MQKSWNKFVAGILVVVIFVVTLALSGCNNSKNSIGADVDNVPVGFTDTGYMVKNEQNRVYHIVSDMNGWLYYCSDVEGNLTPVLNTFGTPTKDTTPFEELNNG